MHRVIITIVLACILTCAGALAAGKPANPLPANAKCPVCGMFVAKYTDWTATARFKDGSTFYYDGPKDMFSHYLDTGRYTPGKGQADIVALAVKEYYSLEAIDPRGAFFVIGSDVYGPMGSELIPFKSEKDAQSFRADHRGKKIVRFSEITPQLMKTLR